MMFWLLPLAAVALLLYGADKKPGGARAMPRVNGYVHPMAGQTWTLIICANRALTAIDYDRFFGMIARGIMVRGVTPTDRPNCYAVTVTFKEDAPPLRLGGNIVESPGLTLTLDSAVRAPIAPMTVGHSRIGQGWHESRRAGEIPLLR